MRTALLISAVLASIAGAQLESSSDDGADESPAQVAADGNLFPNPSFENGRAPWWSFIERGSTAWADFSVTDERARTGEHSALLDMTSEGWDGDTRIYGVIQEVAVEPVPEKLSGWFRVEGWERGTAKQYVQVVVIVWNAKRYPRGLRGANNYQIAYTLAGVGESPLEISNRKFVVSDEYEMFVFGGQPEPVTDEWMFFEFELRSDFRRLWGIDPSEYEFLRVLFEVRYDDHADGEPPVRGRVYYDELYMGPESRREEAERWRAGGESTEGRPDAPDP